MTSHTAQMSHSASRTRQLDFNKAMSDFTVMFPTFDYEVIEMILRANNGLVDTTLDQLLAMQSESSRHEENKHLDPELNIRLPSYDDKSAITYEPPPAYTPRVEEDPSFKYDSTFLEPHFDSFSNSSSTNYTNTKTDSEFRPPMIGTLPNDFLRLNLDSHESRRSRSHERRDRAIYTSNPIYDTNTLEASRNSPMSRPNFSRKSQDSTVARPSRSVSRSVTNGFDSVSHEIPANDEESKCCGKKGKSLKFGQMSRKFKRKKTKSAKGATYQQISGDNLVGNDSGEES